MLGMLEACAPSGFMLESPDEPVSITSGLEDLDRDLAVERLSRARKTIAMPPRPSSSAARHSSR